MKKFLIVVACLLIAVPLSYPAWRPLAKRNLWFLIATNVWQDSLRRIGWVSGQIGQPYALYPLDSRRIPQDIARAQEIYRNYIKYAGWEESQIAGKRFLELGPGFNVGVPLLFAAHGASYVAGLDKFVRFQTGPYYQKFYAQLRDTLTSREKAGFDSAIQLQPQIALHPAKAHYIHGQELLGAVGELGPGTFDLIGSNAVIEEVYDPDPIFQAQDRLLRPGGVMVHKIDLRDYGIFTGRGFPQLEFLTVPGWAYRWMAEASGQPNRRRVNYYRDIARRLGYSCNIYVTLILGVDKELIPPKAQIQQNLDYADSSLRLIRDIRPRLIAQFRDLSDMDLMVQGILFIARKPGP